MMYIVYNVNINVLHQSTNLSRRLDSFHDATVGKDPS